MYETTLSSPFLNRVLRRLKSNRRQQLISAIKINMSQPHSTREAKKSESAEAVYILGTADIEEDIHWKIFQEMKSNKG